VTQEATSPGHPDAQPLLSPVTQAALLVAIAGFTDAVGFLRYQAFACQMTGNTVLMALSLFHQSWVQSLYYVAMIVVRGLEAAAIHPPAPADRQGYAGKQDAAAKRSSAPRLSVCRLACTSIGSTGGVDGQALRFVVSINAASSFICSRRDDCRAPPGCRSPSSHIGAAQQSVAAGNAPHRTVRIADPAPEERAWVKRGAAAAFGRRKGA
jgi:hypothetical protein